jgi:multiple sugar transport system substrate-binding protein
MTTRRSTLEDYGIRVPTLEEPWTGDEFMAALDTLKATGDFEYPLDPGMAWTGEWYPYAFSPFLQSLRRRHRRPLHLPSAEGVLNGDEAIAFGEWWQSLFEGECPRHQPGPGRPRQRLRRRHYAITWNGNWAALNGCGSQLDDTMFLPRRISATARRSAPLPGSSAFPPPASIPRARTPSSSSRFRTNIWPPSRRHRA